jgi:hypothetical protein
MATNLYPTEKDLKETIRAVVGNSVVDAIYEGTTQDTLVIDFRAALERIASVCLQRKPSLIEIERIMTEENPGSKYSAHLFQAAILIQLNVTALHCLKDYEAQCNNCPRIDMDGKPFQVDFEAIIKKHAAGAGYTFDQLWNEIQEIQNTPEAVADFTNRC